MRVSPGSTPKGQSAPPLWAPIAWRWRRLGAAAVPWWREECLLMMRSRRAPTATWPDNNGHGRSAAMANRVFLLRGRSIAVLLLDIYVSRGFPFLLRYELGLFFSAGLFELSVSICTVVPPLSWTNMQVRYHLSWCPSLYSLKLFPGKNPATI